jgi:hypothetical protein
VRRGHAIVPARRRNLDPESIERHALATDAIAALHDDSLVSVHHQHPALIALLDDADEHELSHACLLRNNARAPLRRLRRRCRADQ